MRVAFLGSKALGARVLAAVIETVAAPHEIAGVCCPDDSHDARSDLRAFQALSDEHGLPLTSDPGTLDYEAGIVCGWYRLLPADRNLYALHASPLPRYRGVAPIPWQIINGEPEIGLTLFKITEGLDEGPIAAQATVPLGADETVADVLSRIGDLAQDLVRAHLPEILDGTVSLTEQDHSLASYCGRRRPEDGRIDWTWPARRIHDFVRAQTRPYPGAYTTLAGGETLRVWRTELDPRPYLAVPGRVTEPGLVGCGDGAIRLVDVEPSLPRDGLLV
jgi:methionyl-tRNA formyltransferase